MERIGAREAIFIRGAYQPDPATANARGALLTDDSRTGPVWSVLPRRASLLSLSLASSLFWGCGDRPEVMPEVPHPTVRPAGDAPSQPAAEPAATAPVHIEGPHLRVLGTAQDGGLPHAACNCEFCRPARLDPKRRRLVASIGIVHPASGKVFMVDATPDVNEQLQLVHDVGETPSDRVDRAPVDGVLLTHAHIGHYLGLALFGFEAVHTQGLPVWTTEKLAELLRTNAPWNQLVDIGNVELRPFSPGQEIELAPGLVTIPLLVPHRNEYADTVGYVVRGERNTVLYVPDTAPWAQWETPVLEVVEEHGVTIALVDATFYSGDELPGRDLSTLAHPVMVDSMDLFQPLVEAKKLRVVFTHLNHSNPALDPDGPQYAATLARGFEVAADGLEIPL